jgi:hypothetical protein
VKTKAKLSQHQEKVLIAFRHKNSDVPISAIFLLVYGEKEWKATRTVRKMQQKLAPTIAAINDKIAPQRIKPGGHKQTYRLSTKG